MINFSKIKKDFQSKLKFKVRLFSKIKFLEIKKKLKSKLKTYSKLDISEISQKIQEKKIYKKIVFDVYPNLKNRTQKIVN